MSQPQTPNNAVQPFGDLTEEEYEALKASIAEHGLLSPITKDQNGVVLDGNHRLRACRELGVQPRYEIVACDDDDDRYVRAVVMNLLRRHLTHEQKAAKVAELRGRGWTYQQIAVETGMSYGTVQGLVTRSEDVINFDNVETKSDEKPRTVIDSRGRVQPARKPRPQPAIVQAKNDREAARAEHAFATVGATIEGTVAASDIIRAEKHHRREEQKREQAARVAEVMPERPQVTLASWADWLPTQPPCDLLLTDPPYSTDVDDIEGFARAWLPIALDKVKPTGRAYVCTGAYPDELATYLAIKPPEHLTLANVLVWTYRNTLGPKPTHDYKLNWQAILYYRGADAPPLDCPEMIEQFTVQDINAPDGRIGDRWHAWQKPDLLAERIVRHSTRPGQSVLDPFTCTGTFLLAAARLGRRAAGCDIDPKNLAIAEERGCLRAP